MSNNITSQPGANNGMDYQKSNNGYVNAARRSWTGPNILAESTCGCFGKQWSMQWGCCGGKSKAGMKGYGLFDCRSCNYCGPRLYDDANPTTTATAPRY